ncbi:MAG: alpha/beta hydrolase [Chloroflexi bacterium]|nr:alpha/beta hydrolase [Chloroflexota bacterium]
MRQAELAWQTHDGLRIFAREWRPDDDNVRAVVVLVHGLGEHTGRYAHVAATLCDAGYVLLGADIRGHGRSAGERGHSPTYDDLLDDLGLLLEQAGARFPGLPRFLYGHSLGGGIVLNYALDRSVDLAGVIATAPLLAIAYEPPRLKLVGGRVLRRVAPRFSMGSEIDPKALSRDPNLVYRDDPLVHDRLSAALGIDMLENGLRALERASDFSLPLLLMHGGADTITSVQATCRFAELAGDVCSLQILDGLLHEVHNEPEKDEVLALMVAWLRRHTPEEAD